MTEPEVLVTDADWVRTVTLNRPERLNALTMTMRAGIERAVEEFEADEQLRVLVLTGAGRGFCSGADLRGGQQAQKHTSKELARPRFWWHRAFDFAEKPTVCALNGVAAGAGLGLALSCDVIVASTEASITPAFSRLALSPDNGVGQKLVQRVGYSRALSFLLLGDAVTASEAKAWGLVDEVLPSADFADGVSTIASRIAQVPPVATRLTKRLLKDAPGLPRHVELAYEELLIGFASASPDAAAAREAFVKSHQRQDRG